MVDPLLSLAMNLRANRGAYALLLGSGVSRGASVPTGWEVVLDLLRRVAMLESDAPPSDLAAWYRQRHGSDPDYSGLLHALARTETERTQLLRAYFEPTPEEKEQGIKVPTRAHRAVARLVASGYVRVILTTNFDRLIEQALDAEGMTAAVASTPEGVQGLVPLRHSRCTLVKLHGDYLSTLLKNTATELAEYDPGVDRLLDQVLDEYGLIVCGWSGEWDPALRHAIERCPSRRYTTYWTNIGPPGQRASELIVARAAESIIIQSADEFFDRLAEMVRSLEELDRPDAQAISVAVASMKRYVEGRQRIRIHDLLSDVTDRVCEKLSDPNFHGPASVPTGETLLQLMRRYEGLVETLMGLMIVVCHWGEDEDVPLLTRSVERVAHAAGYISGYGVRDNLKLYPTLLLLYVGGMAALAGSKHRTFVRLLSEPELAFLHVERGFVMHTVHPWNVLQVEPARTLPGMQRRYTPLSDHLHGLLRDPMREYTSGDVAYTELFDRFEYLFALVFLSLASESRRTRGWAPTGAFQWRYEGKPSQHPAKVVGDEVDRYGANSTLLKAGLFDGSLEQFKEATARYDAFREGLRWF